MTPAHVPDSAGQCGLGSGRRIIARLDRPSSTPMMIGKVFGPTGSEMKLVWIWVAFQMKKAASASPNPPKMRSPMVSPLASHVLEAAHPRADAGRPEDYWISPISREISWMPAIDSDTKASNSAPLTSSGASPFWAITAFHSSEA